MYQVRNLSILRHFSKIQSVPYIVQQLKERSLLKVAGDTVHDFLQGLITNDMQHLSQGLGCLYTLFLNTKGRVMYDAIVYRTTEENALLIECDSSSIETLQRHLKLYRVKRKISVDVGNYSVYVVYNPNINMSSNFTHKTFNPELVVPCATIEAASSSCRIYRDLLIYHDPRLEYLGLRILAPCNCDMKQQIHEIFNVKENDDLESYRALRYRLGVGEGVDDLPPNNCFPLESNCDYLHGISFHKGCYIGQELTARTHHTGVVRKRLMPLYFKVIPTFLPSDTVIMHENNNLGKLRGLQGNIGLALLRVAKALEFNTISVGNGTAATMRPSWWPVEAPKERINVSKGQVMMEVGEGKNDKAQEKLKIFQCSTCIFSEKYEYYGSTPAFVKDYKFKENVYIIEDPFSPPNKGEFIILGTLCVKCGVAVCKDANCSFYFEGTYCIKCAKESMSEFPESVCEKLNRIVVPC